jgi:hypothetical protein
MPEVVDRPSNLEGSPAINRASAEQNVIAGGVLDLRKMRANLARNKTDEVLQLFPTYVFLIEYKYSRNFGQPIMDEFRRQGGDALILTYSQCSTTSMPPRTPLCEPQVRNPAMNAALGVEWLLQRAQHLIASVKRRA